MPKSWRLKLIALLPVILLMMSCSTTKPLLLRPELNRELNCPPAALEACEALEYPESQEDINFKAIVAQWGNQYVVCQVKHKVLVDCIREFESKK